MAASSVAQKLKLEEEYNKLEEDVAASKLLDEKNCGRVTVWCTSTLKALGSMTFCSAVMSLAVSGDQLFVGDAGGNISIYAHHSCSEGFKAEIRAQVEQSARANLCVSSSFLSRREKLQVKAIVLPGGAACTHAILCICLHKMDTTDLHLTPVVQEHHCDPWSPGGKHRRPCAGHRPSHGVRESAVAGRGL